MDLVEQAHYSYREISEYVLYIGIRIRGKRKEEREGGREGGRDAEPPAECCTYRYIHVGRLPTA